MKFLPSQLAYLLATRETRTNLRALARYLLFLLLLVTTYSVLFHVIMEHVEEKSHSWITGVYWTLVVMTTLGFGDITFATDLGRFFSIIVLLSGVVFLLVMLPFLFIRLFYAPWLEARIRTRAPRAVAADTRDHVILTEYEAVSMALVERLQAENIPYVVMEPDPAVAARLLDDHISVITGDRDNRATYELARASQARMVFASGDDLTNANITLTVRETATFVPIAAVAEDDESVDILQFGGASVVLPLKRQLGESLASRVYTGASCANVIGTVRSLHIAELPGRDTPFLGLAIREARLRERVGVNVIGLWRRGTLNTAFADTIIDADSMLVVAGTTDQITALNAILPQPAAPSSPPLVIVIGAGVVGRAAAMALKSKGMTVHAIDRTADALRPLDGHVDGVFVGNAADRQFLSSAGFDTASSILLSTNADATNIYLALFCRRLKQDLRIVSRITHERNVEAIHRAGADFALSYTSLGVDAVMALLNGHETVLLGEGVELFSIPVPTSLVGGSLRDSGIGSRTGMSVVALEDGDNLMAQLSADSILPAGAELLMLGSLDQRRRFAEVFETEL